MVIGKVKIASMGTNGPLRGVSLLKKPYGLRAEATQSDNNML